MGTHFSALQGTKRRLNVALGDSYPIAPQDGEFFFDAGTNQYCVFQGGQWWYRAVSTTTSTSTSTTTTSTSTTTTSTSSSTTTSTSTSTSTSTTTTF